MILSNDNNYRGNLGSSLKLDENSHVEKPFWEDLAGWERILSEFRTYHLQRGENTDDFDEILSETKMRLT